jgi:hypothetical protein
MGQSLVLLLMGSALFWGYAIYQVKQMTTLSVEINKTYVTEQGRLAQYQAQYSSQQMSQLLADELKQTQARAAAQQSLIDTLKNGALGNTRGYSEYMRAFARQVVNGLWLSGFDITGDATSLSMNGGVLSPDLLPVYVQKLSREKVMQGKTFAALQMQQPKLATGKTHYVEFTLQSEIVSEKPGEDRPGEALGKTP